MDTRVLEFSSTGFLLTFPPTPFQSRVIMLDEQADKFYDVDFQTLRKPSQPSWQTISPESFNTPAIVFPTNQAYRLGPGSTAVGFFVNIISQQDGVFGFQSFGQVMVKEFPSEQMSWDALNTKKSMWVPRMRTGLLGRVWGRQPGGTDAGDGVDGAYLNSEMDGLFIVGQTLPMEQRWTASE